MTAKYDAEKSNLKVFSEFPQFLFKNLLNLSKRILYNYFIRNFNYASLQLLFSIPLLGFGIVFGAISWIDPGQPGALASAGTVMLAALPIIIGFQMLMGFFNYDMANIPSLPLQERLRGKPN